MERPAGSTLKTIPAIVALALVLFAGNSFSAVNSATLKNIRTGVHSNFTRLVFDVEGARPAGIGPPGETSIAIRYDRLQTSLQPEKVSSGLPVPISGVSFKESDGGFTIHVAYNESTASVKPFILTVSKSSYRLVLDFYAQAAAVKGQVEKKSVQKTSTKGKEKQNFSSPQDDPVPPFISLDDAPGGKPAADDKKARALFEEAESLFLAHKEDMAQHTAQIIEKYRAAVKAAPKAEQVPMALYRIGLVHLASGDLKKAEENLKKLISDYPNHPLLGLCWMTLGQIYQQKKSDVEAVLAFRTALTLPLEKDKSSEAYCSMGKSLSLIGSHKEAIEALSKCMDDDPSSLFKRPEVLRNIGESYFAVQQYDKSSDSLLRYINLQEDISDRDLILAKVAETLLYMNEQDLAKKVYSYIERKYPDSEGYFIGKLRRAELLEMQNERGKMGAFAVYQELSQKPASASLSELVVYKMASWEREHGNYEKSLALIDDLLLKKTGSAPSQDLLDLRGKVVADYIRHSFSEKNHARVLDLYEKNAGPGRFNSPLLPETVSMVAESFGALKLYPISVELYQRLLNEATDKKDDWLFKLARYSYLMGDMEKAAQSCLLIRPDFLDAEKAELLGRIYFGQKKYNEAAQQFGKFFQREASFEKTDLHSLLSYAESLMQLGKRSEVLQVLHKASRNFGNDDVEKKTLVGLLESKCYQELKETEKAIEVLERLLPLSGTDQMKDQLNYQLSTLYTESGKTEKAAEKLSQLMGSSQPLWKTLAEQRLDYMQLQSSKSK